MADADAKLLVGSTVKIIGLKAKPELNGCAALVGSFNADKARYNVKCISPELNDYVEVALKRDNLEQVRHTVSIPNLWHISRLVCSRPCPRLHGSRQAPAQGPASRLPPAKTVEADAYAISDVLDVLDALHALDTYNAEVGVACLTRCVESLMDNVSSAELPPARALVATLHALQTNCQNNGSAPQLFGVSILTLPFLLGEPAQAPFLAAAEAKLDCSLLTMLAQGLGWYIGTPEILSSTMIALRQLLSCWIANDDTVEFTGIDDGCFEATVRPSKVLEALVAMLKAHPAKHNDEGSLELHEHAIAAFSACSGLQPSAQRTSALVEAGIVPPTLQAMRAVVQVFAQSGKNKGGPTDEEASAALELLRASGALLKALGRTSPGRKSMVAHGGVATLDAIIKAVPVGGVAEEMGALKARLLSKDGKDSPSPSACPSSPAPHGPKEASAPRENVPSFVAARAAKDYRAAEEQAKQEGGGGGGGSGEQAAAAAQKASKGADGGKKGGDDPGEKGGDKKQKDGGSDGAAEGIEAVYLY